MRISWIPSSAHVEICPDPVGWEVFGEAGVGFRRVSGERKVVVAGKWLFPVLGSVRRFAGSYGERVVLVAGGENKEEREIGGLPPVRGKAAVL
ncbi:hypothetical protein HAX54_051815 [Datura stramonium]|uniref:Uncharacterized protein n=1 Tax=Datura stramonium TaxID=4076 RepID=A0ABS8RRZ9_DATST|nr:hypothetical protein [Datura stramonium]